MGLLSSIGKVVKKVWKGVKKVFGKVMGVVGKITGSKWGKVLMLALAVYTGGMALSAGWTAFGAQGTSASFMTKFVAGSKAFMGSITGASAAAAPGAPTSGVTGVVGGATDAATVAQSAAQGSQAAQAAQTVASGSQAAQTAASGIGAGGNAFRSTGVLGKAVTATAEGASALAPSIVNAAAPAAASGGGILGTLGKAAKGAWSMANSPIGKEVISKGLQGYLQGKETEEEWKREDKKLYGNRDQRESAKTWGNQTAGEFSYNY